MKIYKKLEQGTQEWLELRAGVITGTKVGSIMGAPLKAGGISKTTEGAINTLIYSLMGGEFSYDLNAPNISSYATRTGIESEDEIQVLYEAKTKKKVTNVGFIKKNDWLGLSPDGIIYNKDNKITNAVEYKTPIGNNGANWFKYSLEEGIPKEYLQQIIHYFVVIDDLESLDLCLYNPNIETSHLTIKTITREELKLDIAFAKERLKVVRGKWLDMINKILTLIK